VNGGKGRENYFYGPKPCSSELPENPTLANEVMPHRPYPLKWLNLA